MVVRTPTITPSLMRFVCVASFGSGAPPPGWATYCTTGCNRKPGLHFVLVGDLEDRLIVADRIRRAGEELRVAVERAGAVGYPRIGRGDPEPVVRALCAEAGEQEAAIDIGADEVAVRRAGRGAHEEGDALVGAGDARINNCS